MPNTFLGGSRMFESNSPMPADASAPAVEAAASSIDTTLPSPSEQQAAPDALALGAIDEAVVPGQSPPAETPPAPDAPTPEVPFELDCRQRLALTSLARGSSLAKASRDAGVSRATLYNWMNQNPGFRAAYDRWKAIT